jgi:sulfur-oxidizing protein SoxA
MADGGKNMLGYWMKRFAALAAVSAALAGAGAAEDLPAGVTAVKVAPPSADHPLQELLSGWLFRERETQQLQVDDFDNPGMLWVEQGAASFEKVEGAAGKACISCHTAASLKGVGAAMPKWNEKLGKPVNLELQINACRTGQMQAEEWKFDSEPLKAMTTFVRHQSRGLPVKIAKDGPIAPWIARGKEIYYTRVGQLNMACASCHEASTGKYLRSDHLSQGQSNGFPTFRLKEPSIVSLHNRFVGCMRDVRAEPYKPLSDEFMALEAYLATRGEGLQIETPSVRQ